MKAIRLSLIHFILLLAVENPFAIPNLIPPLGVRGQGSGQDPLIIANQYIQSHLSDWGLVPRDVAELTISDRYTDIHSGITRIYFLQQFNGIPVHNAILNLNISKDGNVFYTGNRLVNDLDDKVNATVPTLSPLEAVTKLAEHLGFHPGELQFKRSADETTYRIDKSDIAKEDITTELCYQRFEGKVYLAWNIHFAPVGSADVWDTRVDAVSGKIVAEDNWTVYCNQGGKAVNGEENSCPVHPDHFEIPDEAIQSMSVHATESYTVWPFPLENPQDGPRSTVVNPADPLASPYGWHDTDGQPGAEYTITRGNNAHVYLDQDGQGHTNNDEPNGGPDLEFNFPYNPTDEPDQYVDAAQVNLFYWANFVHDFTYRFGFDEAAGNYQKNNYGRGGKGNDYIVLHSQYGANVDSSNNAYFIHATDGNSPVVNMFLFRGWHHFLNIIEPSTIAGQLKTSPPSAGWGNGTYITTTPVTGDVVIVNDGIESPFENDACEPILNAAALQGKIALIQRGGCEFGWKALKAQEAGAIGVIVANYDDDNYTMNPGHYGAQVNIPVVMIGAGDAEIIKQAIGNGVKVSLVDLGLELPKALDSDLDNGMITHELFHGVTDRIVGGASSYCLDNDESMAEGWSDFFALALTAKAGDVGSQARGFAYYLLKDESTGKGYRRYPYSTDMQIFPLTYGDISATQETHDLGQVWAAMIWDMYWALVNEYGWSADPYEPSSGNYRAINLVIEGLKNLPCSPGFVDGRDAILAADQSLYDGADVCTIWKVFARRGLGYSADEGSPFDAGDQKEAFDVSPVCTDKILVSKTVTDFIHPGDEIKVTLQVGNFKNEVAGNVKVNDEIPEGTEYKLNSSNFPVSIQGNSISFELGNMLPRDKQTITYTLLSNPETWSKRIFIDEVDDQSNTKWLTYTLGDAAPNVWQLHSDLGAHTGNWVWNSSEVPSISHQVLELNPGHYVFHVDVDHPVLRFYHRVETAGGISGGVVDVKEVGTTNWETVDQDIVRHGYTTKMDYRTFFTPHVSAFSGNSDTAFQATYVDLSHWAGKDIQVRFRFGTYLNDHGGEGWSIDDIEFMDMISYNGEVCVMSDQGDMECAIAPEAGTIVESREPVTSIVEQAINLPVIIFPNPANDHITLQWNDIADTDVNVMLESIDGKMISAHSFHLEGREQVTIPIDNVPAGLYVVKISTDQAQAVVKVIIQ